MCSVCRADVSRFRPDVSSFRPDVFSFRPNVFTLAGQVFSFGSGALVGDGARTEGEIPRLRGAALGMTIAAGADRGRGWRGLAMVAVQAMQSVHAVQSGRATLAGMAVSAGSTPVCGRTLGAGCDGCHGVSIEGAAPVRAAGTIEVRSANLPSQGRGARLREQVQTRTGTGSRGNR